MCAATTPLDSLYGLDRQQQSSQRGCHSWKLINRLLFADDLVLLAFIEHVLPVFFCVWRNGRVSLNGTRYVSCRNSKILAMLVRPSCNQNVSGKIRKARSAATPSGKWPRGRRLRTRWRNYISKLALSVLVWSQDNFWDCCWPWGISGPRAAAPATLPKGKAGMKIKGKNCLWKICLKSLVFPHMVTQTFCGQTVFPKCPLNLTKMCFGQMITAAI